jgi:hypothetical protein
MRMADNDYGVGASGSGDEIAAVDELIADLAALVEAGLVVVHEPILGPARYGVAPMPDHRHADDRRAYVGAA